MTTQSVTRELDASHANDLRFVSRLTWMMGALLLISSLTGLAHASAGWYGYDARIVPAFVAQDLVTLVVALPLLLISATLARRGSTRALLCWAGSLFYVAYSYYFYVAGAPLNPLFPAYIVLVSLGMYGALAILFSLDLRVLATQVGPGAPVRSISAFLVVTAAFFAALWLALIANHLGTETGLDAVSRAVIAVDGVVLLPLLFFGGLWLYRRRPLGYALAGVLLVKAAATFFTLLVATATAWDWGEDVSVLQTTAFVVGLGTALTLLVPYLRSIRDAEGGHHA